MEGLTKAEKITIWTDALCEPKNPGGIACYGFRVYSTNNVFLAQEQGVIGTGEGMTNNLAEYMAVLQASKWLRQNAPSIEAKICTKSNLVANQINNVWSCQSPHLNTIREQILEILQSISVKVKYAKNAYETVKAPARLAFNEIYRPAKLGGRNDK